MTVLPNFSGAILAGGQSSRMGTDKAMVPIAGIPMAMRVATAMHDAGAREVFTVGGDIYALGSLGLRVFPDDVPHRGPLAGLIVAMKVAREPIVVVTACDMPWIDASQIRILVAALGTLDVAVATSLGQVQPLFAAWSPRARGRIELSFRGGERSPLRIIKSLAFAHIELGGEAWSRDIDTPEALDGFTHDLR